VVIVGKGVKGEGCWQKKRECGSVGGSEGEGLLGILVG